MRTLFLIKELLKKRRTLIFCNSIEQTDLLGNSINSNAGIRNLLKFNEGKINFISACQMLNEGANLVDCQVGVFGNLNNSELIVKQRNGRLLRHKEPIIIVPYFINTREEQLKDKMLLNYNPKLITTISSLKDLNALINN